MSFRIEPAREKNHKPDVFKTAMRLLGEQIETSAASLEKKDPQIRLDTISQIGINEQLESMINTVNVF